jgi:hypothetical protein
MLNRKILIINSLLILILLSVIFVVMGLNLQPKPQLVPSQSQTPEISQPTQEPQQKQEPIDTSNWKTYRNEKYGFEVRYPGNFKINEDKEVGFGITLSPSADATQFLVIQPDIGFDFFDEYLPLNWEETIEKLNAIKKILFLQNEYESYTKKLRERASKIQNIIFAGREAVSLKTVDLDPFDKKTLFYTLKITDLKNLPWSKNNRIHYEVEEGNDDLIKIFDQILSNFKFIKPSGRIISKEEMADIRGFNAVIISSMVGLRSSLELFYSEKGSYAGFNCNYQEAKEFCNKIKDILKTEPVIKTASEAYCAYIKIIPENDVDQFYCISSDDSAGITNVSPSLFCNGQNFHCPAPTKF